MSKVCFLTVQFLEEARYTADNLLIAKMMSDRGVPLDPGLMFYVRNSHDDSSLFFDAIDKLFVVKSKIVEGDSVDEVMTITVTNSHIDGWLDLNKKISQTSMYEAFRMSQLGLESNLLSSSDYFDGSFEGEFTSEGLQLKICGTSYYMLYHEFLEDIFSFIDMLNKQFTIWEELYYEHNERSQRNTYHAS
ncbi:hypothetical protein BKP35_12120 [Anaerobacillus arseniciselenatis]|uniref:Uncharacterized protein n=1 Tax=Anaerobacillus arseniciselenatis TaxID=85682 RepID=A0A1S2LG38_9BACI|nr:hypothetical protein [Anaerobacillus arseniciselenatis]OIJ11482.1 hypothetical protein BKP35_12120 [Anaerobacillus arseniciselenatis]